MRGAHDLAVLKVDFANLPPPVPLGSSSDLRVGQTTFAIGNPFGLDWTLTAGIVSALDRSLQTEDGRGLIEHLIQTDAAINCGTTRFTVSEGIAKPTPADAPDGL